MTSNPFYNQRLTTNLKKRNELIKKIRSFFDDEGFLEVETPIIVKFPGQEPYLDHFQTTFENKDQKDSLYLNTSPELEMKKLLTITTVKNIFQITKSFRNNEDFGNSRFHNPEFTMLEWYRQGHDYEKLMDDLKVICQKIGIERKWRKLSVKDAFLGYAKINLDEAIDNEKVFSEILKNKGHKISQNMNWNDLFHLIFLNEIEPNFKKNEALILYDYPRPLAALARKKEKDPKYAERFELYIDGIEIANAYTELTDKKEQIERFKEDQKERKSLNKYVAPIDKDFIASLEYLKDPTCGIALGIDRLIMIALNAKSIKEVIPFSTLTT